MARTKQLKYKIIDLEQGWSEWLDYRKAQRNASESSIVMGLSPFMKPSALASQKWFGGEGAKDNPFMQAGHRNEPIIRENINVALGKNFEPLVIESTQDSRFSASLDGMDGDTILEIKYSKKEFEQVAQNKKPSEYYEIQVQHQLMVSGAKKAIFAVGKGDNTCELVDITYCEVLPNKKIMSEIKTAWDNFEKDYKDLSFDEVGIKALADELIPLMKQKELLSQRESELKEQIKALTGGKDYKGNGISLYTSVRKGGYDYAKFVADHKIEIPSSYLKADTSIVSIKVLK